MTVQLRKFTNYNQLAITNVEGDFAFGITNFNVTPTLNTYIGSVLDTYAKLYEQYRIRRVMIQAQCGKGYTNDRRIKTILVSRVDVDNQDTSQTFNTFRSLANATNARTRTLTEKGNIMLADFRPLMFDVNYTSNDTIPVLPNGLQWNRLVARNNHQWRGAVLGVAIPENTLSPQELKITLTQQIVIEFRGRINDASSVSASPAIGTLNPPTYDFEVDINDLRQNLLAGTYFPTLITHSIGNIGHTIHGDALIGNEFRVESSQTLYRIDAFSDTLLYCTLIE